MGVIAKKKLEDKDIKVSGYRKLPLIALAV